MLTQHGRNIQVSYDLFGFRCVLHTVIFTGAAGTPGSSWFLLARCRGWRVSQDAEEINPCVCMCQEAPVKVPSSSFQFHPLLFSIRPPTNSPLPPNPNPPSFPPLSPALLFVSPWRSSLHLTLCTLFCVRVFSSYPTAFDSRLLCRNIFCLCGCHASSMAPLDKFKFKFTFDLKTLFLGADK